MKPGYSQSDSSKHTSLVDSRIAKLKTSGVGKIVTFYPEGKKGGSSPTADIQLVMQDWYQVAPGLMEAQALPLLLNVPLVMGGAGDWFITYPIKTGDECLVVFTDLDFTEWFNTGKSKCIPTLERHSFSNAIAICGLNNGGKPLVGYNPNEMEIRDQQGEFRIQITKDGIKMDLGKMQLGNGDVDMTEGNVLVQGGNITVSKGNIQVNMGDVNIQGTNILQWITSIIVWLSAHTHNYTNTTGQQVPTTAPIQPVPPK